MPLIVLAGRPSTGKTVVAERLAEYLRKSCGYKVVVVLNEESLHIDRSEGYKGQSCCGCCEVANV